MSASIAAERAPLSVRKVGPMALIERIANAMRGVEVSRDGRFLTVELPNEHSALEVAELIVALDRMAEEAARAAERK